MGKYPKYIYPYEVLQIAKSYPPLLKQPVLQELPVKKLLEKPTEVAEDSMGCFGGIFLSVVIFGIGILCMEAKIQAGAIFIAIAGFIMIYYIFGWESIKARREKKRSQYLINLKDYQLKLQLVENNYEKNLTEYNLKKQSFESDRKAVENENLHRQSEDFIVDYRKRRIQSFFLKSEKPKKLKTETEKSVTHAFFLEHLKLFFQYHIHENVYIENSNFENLKYIPDYVIYDNNLNLFIDIEIDEPYIGSEGIPMHFTKGNDQDRDNYFTKKKWIVIRFAEIQVIENPQGCCALINDVLLNIKKATPQYAENQNRINFTNDWNKDEAHQLAFSRFRNTYLPHYMAKNLELEKLETDNYNLNLHPKPKYDDIDDLPF